MHTKAAKAGDSLPQFPLKVNQTSRGDSPQNASSTRQNSGNTSANSSHTSRFFYPFRPDQYNTTEGNNNFLKPKAHQRSVSSTDNNSNTFFHNNAHNANLGDSGPRFQSEDDVYAEAYDIPHAKFDNTFHTRYLSSLKKLNGQYENEFQNFNRQVNDEKTHLENKIFGLAKEKQDLHGQMRQKEDLLASFMKKSEELQAIHSNEISAMNERYDTLNKEFSAFSSFCQDKTRILSSETEESLYLYKKRFEEQSNILETIKEKINKSRISQKKKEEIGKIQEFQELYKKDKALLDSILELVLQSFIDFSTSSANAQQNSQSNNDSVNEKTVKNDIIDVLQGMVNSFSRDKRGVIYVKDDISKQVRELKKNLKIYTNIIGDKKILELLENLIQVESTAINSIITRKKNESGSTSNQMEDFWYSIFHPYSSYAQTLANQNDYAYIDLAYIMTLLSYTDNFSFNYLLETSMLWGNRHWFYIGKDSLFNKYILGKLDANVNNVITDSILQITKRPDTFKSGHEMLEFFDSFCGHLPQPIEHETGNNLWHIAAMNNNGPMVDYLTSHEEYYPSLKWKNRDGKTALQVCMKGVKEKLVWATVFQLASEAFDLYRQSQYTESCDIYIKAIKLSEELLDLEGEHGTKMSRENLAKLYTNKAKALIQLGDWLEAIDDCEKSLSLNADMKSVYFTLITLYENLLDWKSALDVCNRLYEKFKVYERIKMNELREQVNATRFQILQVPSTANPEEIKRSYLKLCMIWHPDKVLHDNKNIKKRHQNHFNRINEAKDHLDHLLNRQTESNKKETKYVAPKPSELINKPVPSPTVTKPKAPTQPTTPENKNKGTPQAEKPPINRSEGTSNSNDLKPKSNQTKKPSPQKKHSSKGKDKLFNPPKIPKNPKPSDDNNKTDSSPIPENNSGEGTHEFADLSDEQVRNRLEAANKSLKFFMQERQSKEEELYELKSKKKENPNTNNQLETIVFKELSSLITRFEKKESELKKLLFEYDRRTATTSPSNTNQPSTTEKDPQSQADNPPQPTSSSKDPQPPCEQTKKSDSPAANLTTAEDVDTPTSPLDAQENFDTFYSPIHSPQKKYSEPPCILIEETFDDFNLFPGAYEKDEPPSHVYDSIPSSPTNFPTFSEANTSPLGGDPEKDFRSFMPSDSFESNDHSKKSTNVAGNASFFEYVDENNTRKISQESEENHLGASISKPPTKDKTSLKTKRKKNKVNSSPHPHTFKEPSRKFKSEVMIDDMSLNLGNEYNPIEIDPSFFQSSPPYVSHASQNHLYTDSITFEDPHSAYATESESEPKIVEHMFNVPYEPMGEFPSEELKIEYTPSNEPLLSDQGVTFFYEDPSFIGFVGQYEDMNMHHPNVIYEPHIEVSNPDDERAFPGTFHPFNRPNPYS